MVTIKYVLTLAALATASLGVAQDYLAHPSLEITIAKAETVVVGKVIAVSGSSTVHFTISVDEVIKGKAQGTVDLVYNLSPASSPDNWIDISTELPKRLHSREQFLWFLNGPSWGSLPLTRSGPARPKDHPIQHYQELVFDAGFGYPMFSEDLSVLDTKREILEHARRFVKHYPGQVERYAMGVPEPVAGRSGWTFAANHIDVPVTEELEETAKRLIENPDFALPKTWDPPTFFFDIPFGRTKETLAADMRQEGIFALGHFKSDANIKLLQRCLSDPGVEVTGWGEYKPFHSFIVRDAAKKVLAGWGVAPNEPVDLPTVRRLPG